MNSHRMAPLPVSAVSLAIALLLLPVLARASATTQPAQTLSTGPDPKLVGPYDPTDAYDVRAMHGWTVRINQRLLREHPRTAEKLVELLGFQLYQITREIPQPALEKIQTVNIWVEDNDPLFPGMCYHSERDWVAGHGLNPDKTHGVELANAENFLDWIHTQPWMVFHELAHAYHDQFLPDGFDNAEVRDAYESAKSAGIYESILRNNGHHERAYAMTNRMEYFAEQSEAFFGTNDFFPFVRAELKEHDPKGYQMLRKLWGVDAAKQ